MASPEERLLALAVARGLLEPEEVRGGEWEALVSSGRLKAADRASLEQDLEELEAASSRHWSLDMTRAAPEGSGGPEAPTADHPVGSDLLPDPLADSLAGIRASRAEGIFRVRQVAHWGRYESLELVGEGGMGRIFRAEDPKLHRLVALKLLRRDDPELLRRFLQEAQLQARVDHPNVCRVYEVGEWRGQPYIAMQFVPGETLREAADRLSLETLLALMVEVCEGVHAAHRVGLVHRDLKPSNLMVERLAEGGLRACVLDFGLARGQEGGGVTQSGHVMGTVSFMSPEQARGESGQLDRRSDVYSLGATLYTLLAKRPPFEGEGLECMTRIVKDDPAPLRRLAPGLPADLETVVHACLEKDPRRRYASARALGEDLQRILDGEPIQVRPATVVERALHWARKRKATVTAAALVLLAGLVFGGFSVRERIRSREQMAYAQRFAQAAERIEALARYLRLQPARDLRPEQADLLARVNDLQSQVATAGALAQAPGAYALGRAHLALGEPAEAKRDLEEAWALGYRAPEAAHALGRALAALYQVEIGKAYALPDPQLRERRIEDLDRTLREPAADWLHRGAAASLDPAAYQEGILALMQGDPRRAEVLARQAQAEAPWFYEALRLRAEAILAQARRLQDPRAAGVLLAQAGDLLARAEARAPCDVDLLRLEMRLRQEAVVLGWQTDADPRPFVLAQIDVANRWALLEPAAARPLAWRARARAEEARYLALRGRDPSGWLSPARADMTEALRRDGQDVDALTAAASVLRTEGIRGMDLGKDPTGPLKEAVQVAQEGIRLDPSQIVLLNIQNSALLTWIGVTGLQRTFVREEALPYLQAAEREAQSHPDEAYFQANVGGLVLAMAQAELAMGQDPRADAEEACRVYQAALRLQPNHVAFHRGVMVAYAILARALARDGADPGSILAATDRAYERARSKGVPLGTLSPFLLQVVTANLEWSRIHHRDVRSLLEAGRRLEAGLAYDSEDPDVALGTGFRFILAWLRAGTSADHGAALQRGRMLSRRMAGERFMDPSLWEALADFETICGNTQAAKAARARAARVEKGRGD